MFGGYIQIFTLISVYTVNGINGENSIAALKKILNELNAQTTTEDRYDDNDLKFLYKPRYYKHGKPRHHDRSSPNLMNVQTMNLFMKPNKRQREEAEINRLLRTDDSRTCAITGRCGCTGSRCGESNRMEDDVADEVDRVVNTINERLAKNDDQWDNDRNREYKDNRLQKYRDKADDDDDNEGLIDRGIDNADHGGDIDKDMDNDSHERAAKKKNRDNKEDDGDEFLNGRTFKINDEIDVVILNKADLEKLLRNNDFIDLTRDDIDKNIEDQDVIKNVLLEYKKMLSSHDNTEVHRSSDDITPEDIFKHYETMKKEVLTKVLNYVKDKKTPRLLRVKDLTLNQKNKLRKLKAKYRNGDVEESEVEHEILQIIFGEDSNIKILSHDKHNNHIYLPKWLYDKLAAVKKPINDDINVYNDLRALKRILPLTSQQREKLFNKERTKIIPKLVWRKNLGQSGHKFGIPFDMQIHGLGQIAP